MKRLIVVTEAVQKPHAHKLHPKDSFCPECGENVMQLVEVSAEQCKTCRKTILPSYTFCPGCGQAPGDVDEEHHVFLGVPVEKDDYEAVKAHMGSKSYSLERKDNGKGWKLVFKKEDGE